MANKFQVKRTTVSGRTPNTTNSGNTHFIDTGELALNLTDGKMFSSNGSVYFEVGANLQNISISSNATFGSSGKIVANGSFGTSGQVLTSNGTTMYWSTVAGGGGGGGRTVTATTGDGSTTSFNVTYELGYLDVYLNGVKLVLGTDFTATNGTSVVFTVAPASSDSIEFVSFTTVPLASGAARTITSFTGDGTTSTYSVTYDIGFLDVYINGVKYSGGVDFTATNGSSVVFNATPLSGDNIELVAFRNTFSINDAVAKSGDTMTGSLAAPAVNVGTSKFIANTTAVLIAAPLTANGSTGTAGDLLYSNGASGSPYWRSLILQNPVTANGSTGTTGHVLYSNGASGSPYWATPLLGTVQDDIATNDNRYILFANQTSGAITSTYVSSTKMYFNPSTGKLNATSFNSLSDETIKENVKTIGDAMTKVNSMRGVSFTWKDTSEKSIGVIAQEVEKIIPEVVSTGSDGIKSVSYDSIVGLLIEAIKEQQSTIDQLKESVQSLMNSNSKD